MTTDHTTGHTAGHITGGNDVALVDLVDRLIDGGVVIGGDVVLSLAGVDLVYLGLRLVLTPAHTVDLARIGGAT